MKKIQLLSCLLLLAGGLFAQTVVTGAGANIVKAGAPTGACYGGDTYTDNTTNIFYYCRSATWTAISTTGSGGSGTVTNFSAGNFNTLFNTSVANASTAPALSFTATQAAAGTLFGNFGTSAAVPAFTAFSPGASKCYINDTNGTLSCDTPVGTNFPDGTNWNFNNPTLTALTSAASINLTAASTATGFQLPFAAFGTAPTAGGGIAIDSGTNQIGFNDGVNNHFVANVDYLSVSPQTNGLLVQIVGTGTPPALSTVSLTGNTNDITITNPDGTAGSPTIASVATGVTAGSYTCPTLTINAFGKITAATTGTCSGSGSGNTTSTSLVTGNAPTASGVNSIIDSGVGLSGGVETFNGSTSGTFTLTPNSTASTLTIGGSATQTVISPTGSSSAVVLGTATNTGIHFANSSLNYVNAGTSIFSAGSNAVKCAGTACIWSGSGFTQPETFQSGVEASTTGTAGGAAIFRSADVISGTTTGSATGAATFQSGNNAATGGTVQTIGNATFTAGGFTGASGAATTWNPGYTIVGQNYWADTTTTAGTLACITTPGTNSAMPKVGTCTATSNIPWIGIIASTTGQSVFVVESGNIANAVSHASQTDTAGYFVCTDSANAGDITVQSTPCPVGNTVGWIEETGSGGTSHSVHVVNPVSNAGSAVASITGDGTLVTNSASTGAVTLTLGTAGAHTYFGNNTGSTAAPGYVSIAAGDLPGSITSNTSGTAANITATSNSTLTTLTNGSLTLGANSGNLGVLQLDGSTSGNFTITPNATSTTATLGGSGYTTLLVPNGSASAVSIGSAANTGIYGLNGSFNYASGGVAAFQANTSLVECFTSTTCIFRADAFTHAATHQSGVDAATAGTTGGAAIFKSAGITSGTTTASATGNVTVQSGDNAATGGAVQTVGNTIITSGGFTGASGAATAWVPGYTEIYQKYWADTTTTTGTLACYTTPGTNGQMPKVGTCTVTSNIPWIGIIVGTSGQSVQVAKMGHVGSVVSNASSTDTAGYFVCTDSSNAGKVVVQSTACTAGQGVGFIDLTGSGGTSHNVDVQRF